MNKYGYSIIIPHKNSPALLQRCIASIPQRDDIQIIVVDDNSDETLKPRIDRSDVRVVLLGKENSKGAGHARNEGLKVAEGKWVLFIDADDTFTENLSLFLEKHKDSGADVVYFNYNRITNSIVKPKICPASGVEDEESAFMLKYGITMPWNKMVKFGYLQKHCIRFEECPVGNDIFYTYQVGFFANGHMVFDDTAVYNYYIIGGSITRRKKADESYYLTICKHIYQCNAFYKFIGRKGRTKNMFVKFAAILKKKGVDQMFLAMWVYITHYNEIKASKNLFIEKLGLPKA